MTPSDGSLLQRYAEAQDADAFAELVRRYAGPVYGTCLRVVGNAHDAEDVAQECFLELARKAGSIVSSLSGWLHTAATRRAIDAIRRSSRRRRHEERAMSQHNHASEPTWAELAPLVDEALEGLPELLREPLVRHYLEGRSQGDIAAGLGVSQSTVSRRIERALDGLRATLRERGVIASAAVLAEWISPGKVTTRNVASLSGSG